MVATIFVLFSGNFMIRIRSTGESFVQRFPSVGRNTGDGGDEQGGKHPDFGPRDREFVREGRPGDDNATVKPTPSMR